MNPELLHVKHPLGLPPILHVVQVEWHGRHSVLLEFGNVGAVHDATHKLVTLYYVYYYKTLNCPNFLYLFTFLYIIFFGLIKGDYHGNTFY